MELITERDLNGDGRPELIVANFGDKSVSVFPNRGEGSFGPKRDYKVGAAPVGVAAGDLNSDRKPDLVVTYADTVSTLLNNGAGRSSRSSTTSFPARASTRLPLPI